MDLNSIWFVLVGILFTGYVMLDGFDLGVGAIQLFHRNDTERRLCLNAIGPIWDGNEVWLVTGGGALFAAFPEAYATAFSGFYEAFMLLLVALIFRAVAIEFRSKEPTRRWRQSWDVAFSLGSIVSALLIGVAMANVVQGVPLDNQFVFTGNFLTLISPYSVFFGFTVVALFAMHGNIYLILKTEDELQAKLRRWVRVTIPAYIVCFVVFNVWTIVGVGHIATAVKDRPWILGLGLFAVLAVAAIPREVYHGREWRAFLFSCLQMALLMSIFGASVYPNLLFSSPNPANSITIYNGSSTEPTLRFMLYVALIGVPIVIAYGATIHYIFRGKVKLTEESY